MIAARLAMTRTKKLFSDVSKLRSDDVTEARLIRMFVVLDRVWPGLFQIRGDSATALTREWARWQEGPLRVIRQSAFGDLKLGEDARGNRRSP